jgi:hypothetical protein
MRTQESTREVVVACLLFSISLDFYSGRGCVTLPSVDNRMSTLLSMRLLLRVFQTVTTMLVIKPFHQSRRLSR